MGATRIPWGHPEGYLEAFANIDDIIKLIRASEDQAEAKAALQKKYRFSERQAQDIVDLRLGQLTKLDGVKLNEEKKALEGQRKELKGLLADEKELKKLVVEELAEDAKKYGDERRTIIKTAERAQVQRSVVDEPITAIEASRRLEEINVQGPFSADTVFLRASRGEFDAVVACYHDQAMIPVKCLSFGEAVNVTLGLPFIRT